jgi:predicted restriction endonuclease
MSNQFLVLIDKSNNEKFRKFKLEKFNNSAVEILNTYSCKFVWGIHKGKMKSSLWSKLKKHDNVYFTIPEENFKISANLTKKIKNPTFGKLFYPHDLDANSIQYFLFFNEIQKIDISFNELIHNSVSKMSVPVSGIYEIKKSYRQIKNQKTKPKKFILPASGPAKKNKSEVWRFLRDPKPVRELKTLYRNKCQICAQTFEIDKNKFYSEVHHYHPLEENGDDDKSNMIVVCPNHHTQFDYKIIVIGLDGSSIINKNGKNTPEKITFHKSHIFNKKNIESQLE